MRIELTLLAGIVAYFIWSSTFAGLTGDLLQTLGR